MFSFFWFVCSLPHAVAGAWGIRFSAFTTDDWYYTKIWCFCYLEAYLQSYSLIKDLVCLYFFAQSFQAETEAKCNKKNQFVSKKQNSICVVFLSKFCQISTLLPKAAKFPPLQKYYLNSNSKILFENIDYLKSYCLRLPPATVHSILQQQWDSNMYQECFPPTWTFIMLIRMIHFLELIQSVMICTTVDLNTSLSLLRMLIELHKFWIERCWIRDKLYANLMT